MRVYDRTQIDVFLSIIILFLILFIYFSNFFLFLFVGFLFLLQILRDVHSHWVTHAALNPFHDQLLLTAGTML